MVMGYSPRAIQPPPLFQSAQHLFFNSEIDIAISIVLDPLNRKLNASTDLLESYNFSPKSKSGEFYIQIHQFVSKWYLYEFQQMGGNTRIEQEDWTQE